MLQQLYYCNPLWFPVFQWLENNALGGAGAAGCAQWSISILTDFSTGHMTAVNKNDISQLPMWLNVVPGLSSHLLDLSIPWQSLETFLKSHWVPFLSFYSYLLLKPVAWTQMLITTLTRKIVEVQWKEFIQKCPCPNPCKLWKRSSQREFEDVIKTKDLTVI